LNDLHSVLTMLAKVAAEVGGSEQAAAELKPLFPSFISRFGACLFAAEQDEGAQARLSLSTAVARLVAAALAHTSGQDQDDEAPAGSEGSASGVSLSEARLRVQIVVFGARLMQRLRPAGEGAAECTGDTVARAVDAAASLSVLLPPLLLVDRAQVQRTATAGGSSPNTSGGGGVASVFQGASEGAGANNGSVIGSPQSFALSPSSRSCDLAPSLVHARVTEALAADPGLRSDLTDELGALLALLATQPASVSYSSAASLSQALDSASDSRALLACDRRLASRAVLLRGRLLLAALAAELHRAAGDDSTAGAAAVSWVQSGVEQAVELSLVYARALPVGGEAGLGNLLLAATDGLSYLHHHTLALLLSPIPLRTAASADESARRTEAACAKALACFAGTYATLKLLLEKTKDLAAATDDEEDEDEEGAGAVASDAADPDLQWAVGVRLLRPKLQTMRELFAQASDALQDLAIAAVHCGCLCAAVAAAPADRSACMLAYMSALRVHPEAEAEAPGSGWAAYLPPSLRSEQGNGSGGTSATAVPAPARILSAFPRCLVAPFAAVAGVSKALHARLVSGTAEAAAVEQAILPTLSAVAAPLLLTLAAGADQLTRYSEGARENLLGALCVMLRTLRNVIEDVSATQTVTSAAATTSADAVCLGTLCKEFLDKISLDQLVMPVLALTDIGADSNTLTLSRLVNAKHQSLAPSVPGAANLAAAAKEALLNADAMQTDVVHDSSSGNNLPPRLVLGRPEVLGQLSAGSVSASFAVLDALLDLACTVRASPWATESFALSLVGKLDNMVSSISLRLTAFVMDGLVGLRIREHEVAVLGRKTKPAPISVGGQSKKKTSKSSKKAGLSVDSQVHLCSLAIQILTKKSLRVFSSSSSLLQTLSVSLAAVASLAATAPCIFEDDEEINAMAFDCIDKLNT
jgi:hypothetical protein